MKLFLLRLAFKNVLRKLWRSSITAVPVLVGVYMIIVAWSLIDGIDNAVIFGQVKSDSGHFRVMSQGYLDDEEEAKLDRLIDGESAVRQALAVWSEARIHPRLSFQGELSDGRFSLTARGIGVDPETYFAEFTLPLESELDESDSGFADMGLTPMWLGATLAAEFGVETGDTLTVLARTRHGSYTADDYLVTGLIRSRNPTIDNFAFFLPLVAARRLLDCDGAASELVGMLPSRHAALDLPEAAPPLLAKHGLEVQNWRQRAEPILRINRIRRKILACIVAVIVLVAAIGIANTVVMAAFERIREIGALRSLGLQIEGVVVLFLAEALLIGLVGAAVGCVLGIGVVQALDDGLDLSSMVADAGYTVSMSTVLYFDLRPIHVALGFLVGLVATLVAALFPALKFSRLSPMEAMRR